MKVCSKCGECKELSHFNKRARSKDGFNYSCRDCNNEVNKVYCKNNRDLITEKDRIRRSKCRDAINTAKRKRYLKNKEHIAEYYQKNKERIAEYYQKNKERILKNRKRYKTNVKDKDTYRSRKAKDKAQRRAAKISRTPPWSDRETILLYYETRQALSNATGIMYHVDHIIPLRGKYVSGLHVPENLQIIPASKNISKHNHYEIT
jgi:hypothetical protein